VLEKLYRERVESDVAQEIVSNTLSQAVRERQLDPVAPPRVDKVDLTPGKPFKFSARVEVRSNVEPKDYSGIALERRPAKVNDEDVEQALKNYQRQHTEFSPIEGRTNAGDDDVLTIEVSGKVGDNKVKKTAVMVDLADTADGPLPGLAQQLRGVALDPAQTHDVKYKIADDVPQKELAGMEVSLRVQIKDARSRRTPAIDDELAKDTGEADTLEDLKKKIRERLLEQDTQRVKRELEGQLVREIVKRNPFPIARALVDRYADAIANRARAQLQMMGMDPNAVDPRRLKEQFRDEAEHEARATVLLRAIGAREGVEVTDADVQKRVAELAAQRQQSAKKLRAKLEENGQLAGLHAQLVEEKTLDKLMSQAKIADADPDRLVVTPDEARAAGGKLIVTPDEARAEAAANEGSSRTEK
jgi:trigger factor